MVPCVLWRGTWYIVRKFNDRKVWGPLNKLAKNIKLCYYADTWDFHYNHYHPIFVGQTPPKRIIDKRPPKKKYQQKDWLTKTFVDKPHRREPPKHIVDNVVDLFICKGT